MQNVTRGEAVETHRIDGQFPTASAAENADLFWGLRGGGGNYGVVTSFEYQLHTVGPVFAGIVAYPIRRAKTVIELFRQVTSAAPFITDGAILRPHVGEVDLRFRELHILTGGIPLSRCSRLSEGT